MPSRASELRLFARSHNIPAFKNLCQVSLPSNRQASSTFTNKMTTTAVKTPEFLTISSKPEAPIAYTFFPREHPQSPTGPENHLIVFVNGLGLPAASWTGAILEIQDKIPSHPPILTYDRFSQGATVAKDPLDSADSKEPGYGHDFFDVATDLHEIIAVIATLKLDLSKEDLNQGKLQLILVGASIGAPIVRLYTHQHPGIVAGIILLDSNIANANYSDLMPDPEAPDFDPKDVITDDCTLQQYKEQFRRLTGMFDFRVKNSESLDRRNSPALLPRADAPTLEGPGGKGPWLTVVGHDPDTFAQQSLDMMRTPRSLTNKFINKAWAEYNLSLTKITDGDRSHGVTIATGCGHFIQKDDPSRVAMEISIIIFQLGWQQ